MILDRLDPHREAFEAGTGWTLKPEGACKGEVCVPLGRSPGTTVDVPAVAERLGMPLVHDPEADLWALGPETLAGRALSTVEAPEITLEDLDGAPFELSRLRGQKILVYAWAPY